MVRRFTRPLAGAILLVACAAPGCGKTNTYSYVDVHVSIDPNIPDKDLMTMVVSCEAQVTGAEAALGVSLPRCAGVNTHDLGTFEWSSTASGALQFTVDFYALNRVLFATGTSEAVTLVPNKRTSAAVVVHAVPTEGGNGGSTGTAGSPGTAGTTGMGGMGGSAGTSGGAGMTGTAGTTGTAGVSGTAGAGGTAGGGGSAGSSGTAGTTGTAGAGGLSGGGAGGTSGSAGSAGAGGAGGA